MYADFLKIKNSDFYIIPRDNDKKTKLSIFNFFSYMFTKLKNATITCVIRATKSEVL